MTNMLLVESGTLIEVSLLRSQVGIVPGDNLRRGAVHCQGRGVVQIWSLLRPDRPRIAGANPTVLRAVAKREIRRGL